MIDNQGKEHLGQRIKFEHSRLHSVEEWPASPYKDAVIAAIRSTLSRFEAESPAPESLQCMICASRKPAAVVLEFRSRSRASSAITQLAA
jgi:hypothetical protein